MTTALTTTSLTTTSTLPSEEEVLNGYRAATNARFLAQDELNPDLPELRATHTEGGLAAVQREIEELRSLGVSLRGSVELHPQVTILAVDTAEIGDCRLESRVAVDVETGTPLGEPESGFLLFTSAMEREGDVWKIDESARTQQEQCAPA